MAAMSSQPRGEREMKMSRTILFMYKSVITVNNKNENVRECVIIVYV
jgi:hypothetical protein